MRTADRWFGATTFGGFELKSNKYRVITISTLLEAREKQLFNYFL